LIYARYKTCSFWKCELKPSELACKKCQLFETMYYQFFPKKVHFFPPKHASQCFSNEFLQHYWQESFDSDSFGSQSWFDAYATCSSNIVSHDTREKCWELVLPKCQQLVESKNFNRQNLYWQKKLKSSSEYYEYADCTYNFRCR